MKLIYKYRLKPSKLQQIELLQWLGSCRFLYNVCLEQRIHVWQSFRKSLTNIDQNYELKEAKKTEGFEWLQKVHSQVLQDVTKRVQHSYQNFFRGSGYPKWAKKHSYNSFTFSQVGSLKIHNKRIKLPKLGWFRFIQHRNFEGKVKQIHVIKEGNHWYICIVCENVPKKQFMGKNQAIGIDFGVTYLATLSDGTHLKNPKFFAKYQDALRLKSRKLARQTLKSNSWIKTKRQLNKLHAKIARCRKDHLHKKSHFIALNFRHIAMEDLKLKNMTKSAKGDAENHGKNVAQKSGLNRSLLDSGIGNFRTMIAYKTEFYGNQSVRVNPAYSSQKCSCCGFTSKENRKTQSVFQCISCTFAENADVNAAKNILSSGSELWSSTCAIGQSVGLDAPKLALG